MSSNALHFGTVGKAEVRPAKLISGELRVRDAEALVEGAT